MIEVCKIVSSFLSSEKTAAGDTTNGDVVTWMLQVRLDNQGGLDQLVSLEHKELKDPPDRLVPRERPVLLDNLGVREIEVQVDLEDRLDLQDNRVSLEVLGLPAAKVRRERGVPMDRLEAQEILDQWDHLELWEYQDSLDRKVKADHQGSGEIQVRQVILGLLGLLDQLEMLDSVDRKVPLDHLDQPDRMGMLEQREPKVTQGHEDSQDRLDSQVQSHSLKLTDYNALLSNRCMYHIVLV